MTVRAVLAASVLSVCSAVALLSVRSAPGGAADAATDRPLGAELYGRDCAYCHGAEGAGTFQGPSLERVGAAGVFYAISTGRMPIDDPRQRVRRSTPVYSRQEQEALVAYTASFLEGPAVPSVDLDDADVSRGGVLYRTYCAACHGATGGGGALAFQDVATPLGSSTAAQVAVAVVVGPGTMPSFEAAIAGEDLDAVVAYVAELQEPRRLSPLALPGGRPAEGLVALLVAGVVLGSVAWRIGERG